MTTLTLRNDIVAKKLGRNRKPVMQEIEEALAEAKRKSTSKLIEKNKKKAFDKSTVWQRPKSPQPPDRYGYYVSTPDFTCHVQTDEHGIVKDTAPLLRKFVGQPIENLIGWCRGKCKGLPFFLRHTNYIKEEK